MIKPYVATMKVIQRPEDYMIVRVDGVWMVVENVDGEAMVFGEYMYRQDARRAVKGLRRLRESEVDV